MRVHYLQKLILDKLRYEQPLTYTAMMPNGIESSHFRYHLKLLITDGLVTKVTDKCYGLSAKGQREVDYLSANRTTPVRTPKVITYTLLTHHGKLLLYKKPKEPYRNLLGLIGGKLHFGEDARLAAQREVYEKTGLAVALPTFCGLADIIITMSKNNDAEPLSHAIASVYTLELTMLPPQLPKELSLHDPEAVGEYGCIPDLHPLLQLISAGNFPFVSKLRCSM